MALGAGPAAAALTALSSVCPRLGRREPDGADKRAAPPGPRPSAVSGSRLASNGNMRELLHIGLVSATHGHDALSTKAVDTRGPTATRTSHTGSELPDSSESRACLSCSADSSSAGAATEGSAHSLLGPLSASLSSELTSMLSSDSLALELDSQVDELLSSRERPARPRTLDLSTGAISGGTDSA